jgi:hypothetical protein
MNRFLICAFGLLLANALFVDAYGQIAPLGTSTFGLSDRTQGLGLTRDYNPAIGANMLLGGAYLSDSPALPEHVGETYPQSGFLFQEAELALAAAVDPYFRGDLIIAFHYHHDEFHVHVEEGFITTLSLPKVTFRAGKFYLPFGKHNMLHTHAFPFIDAPLPLVYFFGEEGLNEIGMEASALLPLPWFSEISAYAANGNNDLLFASEKSKDLIYGGKWRNFFDFEKDVSLEVGGSYVAGKNRAGGWTHVYGGDLTLRWKPVQRYKQVIWQTEWMRMTRSSSIADALQANKCDGDNPPDVCQALKLQNDVASGAGGLSSYVAVQFAQRFWVQARFDTVGWPMGDLKDPIYRGTGLIAFVPTEFSAIRLQYSYTRGGSPSQDIAQTKNVHQVMLQFNVSIGAHPAHGY